MSLTREIKFSPAYDKRDPDPSKNYGIHGVTITFLLKGEKGAVQFVLYTNWHLPHVDHEIFGDRYDVGNFGHPRMLCAPPTSRYWLS